MPDSKDDNIVYFPGKPGFYKKGPGEFRLYLGELEDLIEEAEKQVSAKKKKRHLEHVPDSEEADGLQKD